MYYHQQSRVEKHTTPSQTTLHVKTSVNRDGSYGRSWMLITDEMVSVPESILKSLLNPSPGSVLLISTRRPSDILSTVSVRQIPVRLTSFVTSLIPDVNSWVTGSPRRYSLETSPTEYLPSTLTYWIEPSSTTKKKKRQDVDLTWRPWSIKDLILTALFISALAALMIGLGVVLSRGII